MADVLSKGLEWPVGLTSSYELIKTSLVSSQLFSGVVTLLSLLDLPLAISFEVMSDSIGLVGTALTTDDNIALPCLD